MESKISINLKIFLYTILGIFTAIFVSVLLGLQSFFLFFILPIGGIYVGIASAAGLFYGHFRYKKSINYKQYILAFILGLVSFYGVHYISYLRTYVTSDNKVNVWFQGEPISNYEVDGKKITFSKYLELEKSSSEHSIIFRGATTPINFDTGKTVSTIYFYLQLFGVLLGSIGVGLVFHMKLDEKMGRWSYSGKH